jgi:hypothetical protein
LDQNDAQENSTNITNIQAKTERLKKNKISYEILQEKLQASGEPQISTTDEVARALFVQGVVVEVTYNIQGITIPRSRTNPFVWYVLVK